MSPIRRCGLELEALLDPFDHRPRRLDFRGAMGSGRLDIDDDAGLHVDQVVGRVGVERRAAGRAVQRGRRIGQRDVLPAAPVGSLACFIEPVQVLAHGAASPGCASICAAATSAPGTPLAVGIGLDHARIDREAFAADQAFVDAALSDPLEQMRKASLSRKRPCRFLEKVE